MTCIRVRGLEEYPQGILAPAKAIGENRLMQAVSAKRKDTIVHPITV